MYVCLPPLPSPSPMSECDPPGILMPPHKPTHPPLPAHTLARFSLRSPNCERGRERKNCLTCEQSFCLTSQRLLSCECADCKKLHLLCEIWALSWKQLRPNNELTQLPHKLGICPPCQTQICFSDQVYCFWHVHKYLLLTGYQTHQWKALTESLLAVEILISEIVLYSGAEIRTPIVDQHTGMKPAFNCHTHSTEREIWVVF